jgi:hypothetical protein
MNETTKKTGKKKLRGWLIAIIIIIVIFGAGAICCYTFGDNGAVPKTTVSAAK